MSNSALCFLWMGLCGGSWLGCGTTLRVSEAYPFVTTPADVRALQSREYETADEESVLAAAIEVLEADGYWISFSDTKLGVCVGETQRIPIEKGIGTVAAEFALNAAVAVVFRGGPVTDDEEEKFAMVVTSITADGAHTSVRVAFQRHLWRQPMLRPAAAGYMSDASRVVTPEIYREFFGRLSQSLALESKEVAP